MNTDILKKPTPLIKPIASNGGTFYTFTSAGEDLTTTLSNGTSGLNFRFSKFAALNIPNISNASNIKNATSNTIKLNNSLSTYQSSNFNDTTDKNIHFAESFQNYCLNLETKILNNNNYKIENVNTVAERVFFKWLKELGAMRFKEFKPTNSEKALYEEELDGLNYNRVVQYLGEISYSGQQNSMNNMFTEIYIDIPETYGNFPQVFFKTLSDTNYGPGKRFSSDTKSLIDENIEGGIYENHPYNLDLRAQFDCDEKIPLIDQSNVDTDKGFQLFKLKENQSFESPLNDDNHWQLNGWWYDVENSLDNTYYLEPDSFTNPQNEYLAIYRAGSTGNIINREQNARRFIRNKLDGITLDWDLRDYVANIANENSNINSLQIFGDSVNSKDFDFNAILLYYDLYELNGTEVEVKSTNLFGVLFLDQVSNLSNGEGEIQRFRKYRTNYKTNNTGNEYAFKINLKIDTNNVNNSIINIPVIAENNTLAMNLYHRALSQITQISNLIAHNELTLMQFQNSLNLVEQSNEALLKLNLTNQLQSISTRLIELEQLTISEGSNTLHNNFQNLYDLLIENRNKLDRILAGEAPPQLLIDGSKLSGQDGINVLLDNDRIILKNTITNFSYSTNKTIITSANFIEKQNSNINSNNFTYEHKLLSGNNYFKFDDVNNFNTRNSIIIYIDDTINNWKPGQMVRFNISSPIIFTGSENNKYIAFYTNKDNVGKYKTLIGKFQVNSIQGIFEIHCQDDVSSIFHIDKF